MMKQFVFNIKQQLKTNKMKKVIIAAMALLFINASSFAQAVPVSKTTAAPTMTVVKKEVKKKDATKVVPIAKATKATTAPKAAATTTAVGIKKDGTPDKRFKNANAKTVAASTTTTSAPLKKDGTPDMRYKANKKK